jgi:HSP20 family protein
MQKRQQETPAYSFGNVVDNIFNHSLRRFFDENFWDVDRPLTSGSVPVNVRESEKHYELDVIAPGCKKEDFTINLEKNVLSISFNHNAQKQESDEKKGWVRNEFVQQSFNRSFTLDDTVEPNAIEATYADGILRIRLPKSEKAKQQSRKIEVK